MYEKLGLVLRCLWYTCRIFSYRYLGVENGRLWKGGISQTIKVNNIRTLNCHSNLTFWLFLLLVPVTLSG